MKRLKKRRSQKKDVITAPSADGNPLSPPSSNDTWTIRDACKGVQIFGSIGSGKTSGSGAAILKAFLLAEWQKAETPDREKEPCHELT